MTSVPGKCQLVVTGMVVGEKVTLPAAGTTSMAAALGKRCQGWRNGSTKHMSKRARQYARSACGWRIRKSHGRNPAARTSSATCKLQKRRFENHSGMFIGSPGPLRLLPRFSLRVLDHAHNLLQI